MRNSGLPLLIVIIMSLPAASQKNFLPGSIVRNNGEMVRGEIDYRNWEQNPSRISFRTASGIEQNFTKADITAFVIDGKDKYERVYITRDMNPVHLSELTYGTEDLTTTDTIFLRLIVEGNRVSLYEFVDFKTHFFIRPANGQVEELVYKVTLHPQTGAMVENNVYRIQLKKYLTDNPVPPKKLRAVDQLNYGLNSLVKFLSMINESNTSFIPPDAGKKGLKIKFFAGAGVVMSTLRFSGSNEILNSINSGNTFSYSIAVGMDIYSPRNLQNILLRAEFAVSEFNVDATGTSGVSVNTRDNSYSMKQRNFTPGFALLFNFIRTSSLKFYLGPALAFNISSYSKNLLVSHSQSSGYTTTYTDFPILQKNWVAVYIRGGVFIKDKLEVSLCKHIRGSFMEYNEIFEDSHPLSLRIHYRFK